MNVSKCLLVFFMTLGLALSGCTGSKDNEVKAPVQKVGDDLLEVDAEGMKNIKLMKIEETDVPDLLPIMGRISVPEDRMTVVPARVAGRIEGITVASGEPVTQGQILARLFSPDFLSAKEEYLVAAKQLNKENAPGMSASEYQSLLRMARKKLGTMGLSESDINGLIQAKGENQTPLIIRSPRTGVIIDKKAIIGSVVNVGDSLFTIADLEKVWFSGDLYPGDLAKVHKDQELSIEISGRKEPIMGTVSFISPVIDPISRTIKIRALVNNTDYYLKADMYVQGALILAHRKAFLVPMAALVRLQDKNCLFVKQPDGKIKRVYVTISREQKGNYPINEGLKSGDEIVIDGALLLNAALNAVRN